MDITETLYVATREEWREWLAENHTTKSEIWLVSYKKKSGRPSVPYSASVEEALCFGWIDSTRKSLDHERYAQRFTPRRKGSSFSQTNKERLARLIERGKVIPTVKAQLSEVRAEDYEVPADIRAAIQEDPDAWEFFEGTSPSYQRIRAAYVDHARDRPAEFEKRLRNLVQKCIQKKHFGYGIEDFY